MKLFTKPTNELKQAMTIFIWRHQADALHELKRISGATLSHIVSTIFDGADLPKLIAQEKMEQEKGDNDGK